MEKRNATGKDICYACGGTGLWVGHHSNRIEHTSTRTCFKCDGTGKRIKSETESSHTIKGCSYLNTTTQIHFYQGSKNKRRM